MVAGCGTAPGPTNSPGSGSARPAASIASFPAARPDPVAVSIPCPADVLVVFVVPLTCAQVTVPIDREAAGGQTLDLAVITIIPPEVDADDPMVVVGETLGGELDLAGLAPLAGRTGRVTHLISRRGTGQSGPDLGCPELDDLAPELTSRPTFDPVSLALLATAVRTCRDRLTGLGLDPVDFDVAASVLDVAEVRVALGVERWNVIGFGSASRLAVAVARSDPEGTRTVLLDSPVLSAGGDPLVDVAATAHAVAVAADLCAADPGCDAAIPNLQASLSAALDRLDRTPIRLTDPASGASVVLDGSRVARAFRTIVGQLGGRRLTFLTQSLERLDHGAIDFADPLVSLVRSEEDLCFGHLPLCGQMVDGSMLTAVCRDVLPFVGDDPDPAAAAGLGRAFRLDDWRLACDAWDIDPAPAPDHGAIGMPAFVIAGRLDPFSGPLAALVGREDLQNARFVEVPHLGYNAFGWDECPRTVRRFWLNHPDAATIDTTCFDAMRSLDIWDTASR